MSNAVAIEKQLNYAHNALNMTVGWGGDKYFEDPESWTAFGKSAKLILDSIQEANKLTYYDPVKEDLYAAYKLVDFAHRERNVQALIDDHMNIPLIENVTTDAI